MKLRSPIVAMLWEIWRVTRVEAAWKLAFGIVGGLAVLALCAAFAPADNAKRHENIMDNGAAIAMILLVLPHMLNWVSLAKLNGGRLGFPLYLQHTRPVRTAVIVGLPMAYLTTMSSAIYLVSAFLLRLTSGYAFPLLPVAAWIAALSLVVLATTWSIRNLPIQILVMSIAIVKGVGLAIRRLTAVEIEGGYDWPPRLWPTLFDFPLTDYAWIALIGLASFGVTVAMVTRQRRGDQLAALPSTPGSGLWGWLVNLFRLPCPTSSATRAQVWLDLKSRGLPVLTIGVALAIVILLVSAVSGPIDAAYTEELRAQGKCSPRGCFYWRAMAVLFAMFSPLIVLFLGGNAFGIRRRQGRAFMSAFEATQAFGTVQLTVLKLLVKSLCLLAALVALGVSVWTSIPLLGDAVFIQMWNVPLSSRLSDVEGAVAALSTFEQLSLVAVAAVGVVVWVAAFAVVGALRVRYPRRLLVAVMLVLLYIVAITLLVQAEGTGITTASLNALFRATLWIIEAAMVLTIVYLIWTGLAERTLTARYVYGAVAISAAFAAAWPTMLLATGVQFSRMPAIHFDSVLWPVLLPPLVAVLAPWSLNRIRHT